MCGNRHVPLDARLCSESPSFAQSQQPCDRSMNDRVETEAGSQLHVKKGPHFTSSCCSGWKSVGGCGEDIMCSITGFSEHRFQFRIQSHLLWRAAFKDGAAENLFFSDCFSNPSKAATSLRPSITHHTRASQSGEATQYLVVIDYHWNFFFFFT